MLHFKLSVRRKIIYVVVTLSLVILAFGAYMSLTTFQSASGRGRYVKAEYERFHSRMEAAGSGDFAAATFIATDPELVRAMIPRELLPEGPPDAEVVPAKDVKLPKDAKDAKDTKDKTQAPPTPDAAKKHSGRDRHALDLALHRLMSALAGSIDPELVCLLDPQSDTVEAPGLGHLPESALQQSRLLQDIRGGVEVRSRIAVIGSVPYLVAGARIVNGDDVVGSVLLGRKLDTLFKNYAEASNDDVDKRYLASFLKSSTVLASAFEVSQRHELGLEIARPSHREVSDGNDVTPVLDLGGRGYDFWAAATTGYDGLQDPRDDTGQLVMMRLRNDGAMQLRAKFWDLLAYFAVAAVVSIFVGLMLALHITRPIDRYIEATQGLAAGQGDLTQRLEVHGDDELSRLAINLNQVFEQIHGLAGRVQKTAFRVGDSSTLLSASSRSMLDGAKAQAVKIENSTAAVTELSASIQQVAENAGEATKVAQKSGTAAENAIARLGQIRRAVEEAASRIEALGESGKRIGSIVEVIRHISEQTTLLALNAAIEAAHAGEQGRGFAVVADEVSNLAKRVGRSAKDIEDLIATIRDQTTEAVRAMQVGTREVEEGTSLVTNTLASLKTLIHVVEDTATAVSEQAIASDEIARNMDAVRTIAREVLGSSEKAVTEGDHLTSLAHQLEESVKGFKLDASKIGEMDAPKQLPARAGR